MYNGMVVLLLIVSVMWAKSSVDTAKNDKNSAECFFHFTKNTGFRLI